MTPLSLIYRYVPTPPDVQTHQAPTLVLLHGTGGDETDLLGLGRQIAPHANLLSPRGAVQEQGMPRWFHRMSEGQFDLVDLRQRTLDLAAFIKTASVQYGFAPDSVFALGYSNGANIAVSLLFLASELLAGAALLRPMLPYTPARVPDLRNKAILISSGRSDPLIPKQQVQQLAETMTQAGAEVALHWQDSGHALTVADVQAATRWFADNAEKEHEHGSASGG